MSVRLNMREAVPEGSKAVLALQKHVQANVEPRLHELIKSRASQLNGCAFCLDMHTREALAQGEDQRRLFALAAWWEAPFFDEREKAALALTDAVTLIAGKPFPEDVWDRARAQFSEEELGNLILAIAQINVWNRISVATGNQPPLEAPAPYAAAAR